jgi:hypothetical protein
VLNIIVILYLEELKATMRGRFAWLGAAVILLVVGGIATVGTQDTWLDGYGVIAYFLVPLAFIPLVAGAVASPRASRFVESVFTAPVGRRDWLLAKTLVLAALAVAYYLSLIPMMLVFVHHVGVPLLLKKFLIYAPGLLAASVAVGLLVGVLFIGRSIAAPAATGVGILLVYAGFVPLQELMVARGNGATRMGVLTLVSPAVLLKNALGFTIAVGNIPATTTFTWISFLAIILGALVLAIWVFLQMQGVETWEATPVQRWMLTLSIAALCLLPALFADRNYDTPAPPPNDAPPIRALFGRSGSSFAMTLPGGPMPSRCCATILNRDATPLGTDETTARDLLILLPVDAGERITDLTIQIKGDDGLEARPDAEALAHAVDRLESHRYGNGVGPAAPDGHRIETGWVARIPVRFRPTHPWDIGGLRYPIDVAATYRVAGSGEARTINGRAAVEAEVSTAVYEMGAASAILPLVCLVATIVRWRRTR